MQREAIQFPFKDSGLREDVHALGDLIGEVLRDQGGEEFFETVEGDRLAALERRKAAGASHAGAPHAGAPGAAAALEGRTAGREPLSATNLTRAFSTWFQAVNAAEKVHRVRRRRQYLADSGLIQPGGIAECIGRLKEEGYSLEAALEVIACVSIEPRFTPHPTESTRRTILRKQQRIAQDLLDRLNAGLTRVELETIWSRVRLEIASIWQTEEHPREGLTVADEREHVLFYLIEIIYRVIPLFYEEIEAALAHAYSVPAESLNVPCILRFGSWVGGDMESDEEVHAKTIRETLQRHQELILSTYFDECGHLAEVLSQSARRVEVSGALAQRIDAYSALLPGAARLAPARHDRMPYRIYFGQIGERVKATYEGRPNAYQSADELLADIELAADSLTDNRGRHAGYFLVRRFIRRVRTFGFHIAALDVTQSARAHHAVISQGLAMPDWLSLPSGERLERLRELLARDQGPTAPLDATGRRALAVFDTIGHARHRYGARAIGTYIVSGVEAPDDLLAVLLLARWAGITDKQSGQCRLDVAPLLESIETLEGAGELLQSLSAEPAYRRHLAACGSRQSVVIGYSDTNKQAGFAGSRWALQIAQHRLVRAARESEVALTILHARGGSPARGGGSPEKLVQAAPAGAISGKLRLTEQADVVNQSYGLRPIAMRTLERTFAAVVLASSRVGERGPVERGFIDAMSALAARSVEAYRQLVFGDARFVDYLRAATPLDVIERMHIGQKPAVRAGTQGIDGLRAVPWVFAWTQSRHMLPGWYGVGSGLTAVIEGQGRAVLDAMLARWPFFAHLLDDVEAMLARTDLEVAAYYDALASAELSVFADAVRREYELTVRRVLELRGAKELLGSDPTLQRSIALRNPYIDPMHLMQVDLLKRWRATERRDASLFAALRATIGGIAQGLQATG
jgi:phosphoenolpyruvate carboxylase